VLFFSDTEDMDGTTRVALKLLVAIERRHTGSRSAAYYNVAQLIGSSSSWVQKFIRDSGEVKPPCQPLLLRICAAYDQLCERVEQQNKRDEIRLRELKGKIDAVAAGVAPKTKTQI
jgi:hypothetical protein